MLTQLAREAGAYVICTGPAADRQTVLDFGAQEFVDLEIDVLEDAGGVHPVFDGLTIDFVVKSDRAQLNEIVQRVRDGRLRTNIGTVATLHEAVAVFNATARRERKSISAFIRDDSGIASGFAFRQRSVAQDVSGVSDGIRSS